jgi:putative MFS transporter
LQVVPSRIRTKALISVLSAGSAFGYLAASGFSYLLQTWFAWRTLWFVGLPTGLLMLPLSLGIPESFRFLVLAGRLDEACQSMSLYFGIPCTPDTLREFFSQSEPLAEEPNRRTSNGGSGVVPGAAGADVEMTPVGGAAAGAGSARGGEAEAEAEAKATRDFWKKTVPLIASLSFLALAWGIIQYGFVNYVPTMLGGVNVIKTQQANSLIFYSSAASCAFVPVYIYLYGFFSSKWALTIMASWELVMFVAFGASYTTILSNATAFSVWYTFFLGAHNAVYAMITVYSAENFSTKVRGRGTGMISAASRVSGVFAPYSIATILTVGKPWQMSLCVGLPLLVGTVLFAVFSQETANYEVDNVLVFSPVAPLYEEHEVLLDPRTTAPDGGAPGAHQDRGEGDVAV